MGALQREKKLQVFGFNAVDSLRMGITTKLMIITTLLVGFACSFTVYLLFTLNSHAIREGIRSRLTDLASSADLLIDGDRLEKLAKDFKHLSPEEQKNNKDYMEIYAKLMEFKTANPKIKYVYTMDSTQIKGTLRFLVDATVIDDAKEHSNLGDLYKETTEWMYKAFSGPVAEKEIEQDAWGRTTSGYAPVRNSKGKVIAIVGVDMAADTIFSEEAAIKRRGLTAGLISFALALLTGVFISRYFAVPILALTNGTKKVSEGDLDLVLDVKRRDELGILAHSFNRMTENLKNKQNELIKINSEVKDILDNIQQAIFTVNEDLKINPQYSRFASRIFLKNDFNGKNILSLVFDNCTEIELKEKFASWFKKIFAIKRWNCLDVLAQIPANEVCIQVEDTNGQKVCKYLTLEVQPIFLNTPEDKDELEFSSIMVIINDVSEKRLLEQKIQNQQKEYRDNLEQIMEVINLDPEIFAGFLAECQEQIEHFEPMLLLLRKERTNMELINDLFRIMHTIKGNALMFNLQRIGGKAHEIENIFAQIRKGESQMTEEILALTFKKIDAFKVLFDEMKVLYDKFLAGRQAACKSQDIANSFVRVRASELEAIEKIVQELKSAKVADDFAEKLANQLLVIRKTPLARLFNRFPRMVHELATELGKMARFDVGGESIDIDRRIFDKLGDPFMHIIRNSLSHGMETPEERIKLGKNPEGLIKVMVKHRESELLISVKDDGRGLNIERIRQKAFERGLITAEKGKKMLDEEVISLIFRPGFSTVEKVSDVSGRGVGMDVVKTCIENELGGKVSIGSRPSGGTEVTLSIPLG